ncbi:MAG: hypothetical protein BWK80_10515 [Desulfobacteraceae bacterium IS3]|nr:MAG: hypothetical protein BWK80_10515 [Desulfobacteraceae bacterium IS3]
MKGRVNIITDDPIMGNLLEVQLADAGFEAEYFSSDGLPALYSSLRPPGALSAEKEKERMLIISEGSFLRSEKGFHCQLRQHPDTAGIPFVFLMSGSDAVLSFGGHTVGLQTAADGYVCKPFKTEDLLVQIESVMHAAAEARTFRSRTDFGAELSQMSLYDAVRIAELNCKSGELHLCFPPENIRGKIFFDRGKLIAAQTPHLVGEEAVFSLIGEEAGRLDFYGNETGDGSVRQIRESNTALMLRASSMSLESAKLYYRIADADEVLSIISRHIPPETVKDCGKKNLESIMMLIAKGLPVRKILTDAGLSSIRAGALLMRLIDAGIVSAASNPRAAAPNPAPAAEAPKAPKFISAVLTDALRKARDDKMTGVLKFGKNSQTRSAVYFEKGQLIHAWHGRVWGKKSLYRIFQDHVVEHEPQKQEPRKHERNESRERNEKNPVFRQAQQNPENPENPVIFPVPVTVREDMNVLFADGDNEVAVLSRLRSASFDKMLALNPEASEQIAALRDRRGLVYVMGLVQQYGAVREILDASGMTDLQTYKHLLYLFQKGMLIPGPEKKAGIRIVTDTGADLPADMQGAANITVLPLSIMMYEKTWKEGSDITNEDFYRIMADAEMPPQILPPSEADFHRLFGKILAQEDILGVFMSSDICKAFHHAAAAAGRYQNKSPRPNARLEMIDSRLLSLGTGLLVMEACQKAAAGWSVEKLRDHILRIIPTVRIFAAADTPKYLPKEKRFQREGPLSRIRDILGIKPILTLRDGQLTAIDFVRGTENTRKLLGELIRESLSDSKMPITAGIMHSGAEAEAAAMRRFLEQELNCQHIYMSHIGAALGACCGPGAVAAAFFPAVSD